MARLGEGGEGTACAGLGWTVLYCADCADCADCNGMHSDVIVSLPLLNTTGHADCDTWNTRPPYLHGPPFPAT